MSDLHYTFSNDCPVPALRGVTLHDGKLSSVMFKGKMTDAVQFKTPAVKGGVISVTLESRPELQAAVAAWRKAETARMDAAAKETRAALEAKVPGVHEMEVLAARVKAESNRYRRESDQMMSNEQNDGVNPPRPEDTSLIERLKTLIASNPRAALYIQAKRQRDNSHWSDNTGIGAAGAKAMTILEAGGSVEDATAALAERRRFTD